MPSALAVAITSAHARADLLDAALRRDGVVAVELERQVHDAARADQKVRSVEDAGGFDPFGIFRCEQLIVGAARDDPAAQPGDRFGVENAAQRARREDVALHVVDVVEVDDGGADVAGGLAGGVVGIGDDEERAARDEVAREVRGNFAEALQRHGASFQAR